jgi:cytochrome c-type biogenesis protein
MAFMTNKVKIILVSVAFILFSIFVVGMGWLATTPAISAGLILSYVAGLTMIVLPCTLPLVFVIIPMAIGKAPLKALLMAVLFGLGLSITLSIYGAAVGFVGGYIGMNQFVRGMFGLAGLLAIAFGISELGLLNLKLPFFSNIFPKGLQKSGDYTKSFGMGLLLGNAGVGCPNPLFYILLTYIATIGRVDEGLWLGLLHGLGRATPLIFLAILAIFGVNASSWLAKKTNLIKKYTGWSLVGIGAFLLTYLPFGMQWWEESIFHAVWNRGLEIAFPKIAESAEIEALLQIEGGTGGIWPWVFMGVVLGTIIIWSSSRKANEDV